MAEIQALAAARCAGCGTEVAPGALDCPACGRLVHAEALRKLAQDAEQATRTGDAAGAIRSWRSTLELVPQASRQHAQIAARIEALSSAGQASPEGSKRTLSTGSKLAGLGALGLLIWKLKSIVLFVATKAKLLLLGFTKVGTLLSMFASLGLYASLWGWKFALGLILSIYVHEIGHVAALRKLGIAATAPMFIPGLGAFVRLKQYPATPREDAQVGLAGPIWGLAAALAAWLLGTLTTTPLLLAVARVGAWINLFNLVPFGPLDGGRGFRALTKRQRWFACAAIGAGLLLSGEGLLLLLLGVAVRARHRGRRPRSARQRFAALVHAAGRRALALVRDCGSTSVTRSSAIGGAPRAGRRRAVCTDSRRPAFGARRSDRRPGGLTRAGRGATVTGVFGSVRKMLQPSTVSARTQSEARRVHGDALPTIERFDEQRSDWRGGNLLGATL